MSAYTIDQIEKPNYFKITPLRKGLGNKPIHVIGFDTEADDGKPFMLQISSIGDIDNVEIFDINKPSTIFDVFLRWIYANCKDRKTKYVIFGFNLAYEWTQFFGYIDVDAFQELRSMATFGFRYTLQDDNGKDIRTYEILVANRKRFFMTIRDTTANVTYHVLDAMAFYPASLDKVAQSLGLGRKYEKPQHFTKAMASSAAFRAYARQDAYLTRRIGEVIINLHREYDIPLTVSAPHFASRVYRRKFLDAEIPLAMPDLESAGLASYHGGKNGYYVGKPMAFHRAYSYDITSAYPEAMAALPDPAAATWRYVTTYEPGSHGLYRISGYYKPCKWRCLYQHANGFAKRGRVQDVWLTSYELATLLDHREINLTSVDGYILDGPSGGSLANYVQTFFQLKREATGAQRLTAKLLLNSLYGKFFQKVALDDADVPEIDFTTNTLTVTPLEERRYIAGGLYHPPIASLITGYVRAKIHRLEHKYEAIHTSTDGFFSLKPPDPSDIGTNLGQLTVDVGSVIIWRERLYAFRKHGDIVKYALHGFHGSIADLLRIPLSVGDHVYTGKQMITLTLAARTIRGRRYRPGAIVNLPYLLKLGP
jgi:hypothetical protein